MIARALATAAIAVVTGSALGAIAGVVMLGYAIGLPIDGWDVVLSWAWAVARILVALVSR